MATAEKEKKHYWVDDEAQIVYAVIRELTAEEDATVERFKKYGYTIVNGRKPKDEKKKVARLEAGTTASSILRLFALCQCYNSV